jgi:hypothetical protein
LKYSECDGRGSKPCWEVISEPSLEFQMRVLGVKFTDGIELVRSQAQTAAA